MPSYKSKWQLEGTVAKELDVHHHPASRNLSAVYAVYFQLQVYIAVQTHVFIENLLSQGQGPSSNESLHYSI